MFSKKIKYVEKQRKFNKPYDKNQDEIQTIDYWQYNFEVRKYSYKK